MNTLDSILPRAHTFSADNRAHIRAAARKLGYRIWSGSSFEGEFPKWKSGADPNQRRFHQAPDLSAQAAETPIANSRLVFGQRPLPVPYLCDDTRVGRHLTSAILFNPSISITRTRTTTF
jgi:hypothetical protein